jgi:hypothetical protein
MNITVTDGLIITASVFAGVATLLIVVFLWYFILTTFFRDNNVKPTIIDAQISQQLQTFFILLGLTVLSVANFLITVIVTGFSFVSNNLPLLAGVLVASTGAVGFLQYHPKIVEGWIVFRQCFSRFFIDLDLMPIINMIRQLWNLLIGFWNGIYDFSRFLRTGQYRVIFACFRVNGFLVPIQLFGEIFVEFTNDFIDFILLGSGIFTTRWDVTDTLGAIQEFFVSLAPTLICFCQILGFFWVDIATIIQLPSLQIAMDGLFNVFVRLLQIPINSILSFTLPSITKAVEEFIAFVIPFGDWIEDTIYILLESFFSVISVFLTIPQEVLVFFNARYMRIITQPLSIVAILLNMTLEASTHLTAIQAPDRSGIAYFQFGQIIDRLKDAVTGFSELFVIIGIEEECFVRETLFIFVDIIAILTEMIPGALFFTFLPSCCQNPLDYFVDYWFTAGSTLPLIFDQIESATQCMRDILAQLNPPFACSLQHLFNVVVEILRIITQILIFSLDIITFTGFPSLENINLDLLFTELILWCQCTADIIRQFDPDFCVIQPNDKKQNMVCCVGNLLDRLCNLVFSLAKQVIEFIFDIITLPSGIIIIADVRIPVFNDALIFAKQAICELMCAVTSVVPLNLRCAFINTNITCDRPSGCSAQLLCEILSIVLIPATVLNTFLIALRSGDYFGSLFVWIKEPVTLLTQWVADCIDILGAFLDCIVCAALDGGVNCGDDIYQVTHAVATLLPAIRPFFTSVMMIIIKIVLALIKGLFVDHEPIGAIIEAVFAFLSQVVGSLGPALVKFAVDFFNRIGLNFIGEIINALWIGLCPLLEFLMNFIIAVLNIISFGLLGLDPASFCCGDSSGNCSLQPSKRSIEDDSDVYQVNGTLFPNQNNWLTALLKNVGLSWNSSDYCNTTMVDYSKKQFSEMSKFEIYDSVFCIMKIIWPFKNDTTLDGGGLASVLLQSKCDVLFDEYTKKNTNFLTDLRVDEQMNIIECIESRMIIEGIKLKTQAYWLPSDLISNPWRKFIFGGQLALGLSYYFNYWSDRTTQPENLLKPEYKERWKNAGLNTTYLDNLITVDDVKIMLETTRLDDYFKWNNGTQLEAVKFIAIHFWQTMGSIINILIESVVANSDINISNLTGVLFSDPTETSSILSGSIFGIIHQILGALQTITNYWSNPDNLKRNLQFTNIIYSKARIKIQYALKSLINWIGDNSIVKLEGEEEEILFPSNSSYGNDLRKEIRFRRFEFINDLFSWSYNHFPKIYERKQDNLIDYLSIMKMKFKSNLSPIYLRKLLIQTVKLKEYKNNDTFIHELLFKLNDTEFNQKLNELNNFNDPTNENLPYFIPRKTTEGIKISSDDDDEIIDTKWKRIKHTFKLLTKGTKQSLKKWKNIEILYDHIAKVFNEVMQTVNIKLKIAEYEQIKYNEKILYNNEPNEIITNFNIPTSKIVYDDYDNQYIITFNEPDQDFLKREVFIKKRNQVGINVTEYNITLPPCGSTIAGLCQDCFYLDQLVFNFNTSLHHVIDYYLGEQFNININIAGTFLNYTSDPLQTVICGGSLNCTCRFPSNRHSNLCYFGDTSNKVGVSDITNWYNSLPVPPPSAGICGTSATLITKTLICPIFGPLLTIFDRVAIGFSNTSNAGDIVNTLFQRIYRCNWDTWEELTGVQKRFALGETGVIIVGTSLVIAFCLFAIFPSYFGTIFALVMSSTFLFILFGGILVITYGWSYGCGMALPMDLGNDLFNFTTYVLAPKCEVYLSSLINEEYNSENCYSCSQAKQWTYAHCVFDKQFYWFGDNIIFIIQYYFPDILDWLRNAPFPFSLLFQIPILETQINKFANVDWNDSIQYSQYMSCALGYTFVPNYIVVQAALIPLTALFSPAIVSSFVSIFLNFFLLLAVLAAVYMNIFTAIRYQFVRTPYVKSGLIDENAAETPPVSSEPKKIQISKPYTYNSNFFDQKKQEFYRKTKRKKGFINTLLYWFLNSYNHIVLLIVFYSNEFYQLIISSKKKKNYQKRKEEKYAYRSDNKKNQ